MISLSLNQYYVLSILILAIALLLSRAIRYDVVGLLVMALLIIQCRGALSFIGSTSIIVLLIFSH
ncbi:MAG: hypothetical protein ACP5GY_07645 [Vulcanisaeta sp.]